jgi:glucuronate isomerase
MTKLLELHPDRLFPPDPTVRAIARRLFETVATLPIVSPHGHTDPSWFAEDRPFDDAVSLLLAPDHYLLRMLYSQGVALEELGVSPAGAASNVAPADAWRRFAGCYHLFRGTPSRLWLDWVFHQVFGLEVRLDPSTADLYFERIGERLSTPALRPRALYDRFGIEVLATTEPATDDLAHHARIRESEWSGRVITTFRPDQVIDPEHEDFRAGLHALSLLTGQDAFSYAGYLRALRIRRLYFRAMGATATDHGHPTAATALLDQRAAADLFDRVVRGSSPADAELFRAHMLVVMAEMSLEDGLVMQLHPGSVRNHNGWLYRKFGRDKGADIPTAVDYVHALRPLLDRFGNEQNLTLIVFTLDESTYSRELAPLAGHYPALRLGPAWWFYDSPEGMRRFRQTTTETAGFANTVGFNDDTRAFLSIPARHDVARRVDCAYLAELVADHRLDEDEAAEVARNLAYDLAKRAYRL